jgi:DNA repair exonuclease SbcCD nuclease subunit
VRFIHTGDWHIGALRNIIPGYLDRVCQAIDNIFSKARELGIHTVVVAGDIFDSPDVLPEERSALARRFYAYDQAGFTIIIIPGNHDKRKGEDGLIQDTSLRFLAEASDMGLFQKSIVTEQTRIEIVEDTAFLLFTGEAWSELSRHIHFATKGSVSLSFKHLVVVAHATIKGSATPEGFRLTHGDVLPKELSQSVTYMALGDIHQKQSILPNAWYPGSPLQVNFGEKPGMCGVLEVDTGFPENPIFHLIESIKLLTIRQSKLEEYARDNPEEFGSSFVRVVRSPGERHSKDSLKLPVNAIKMVYETEEPTGEEAVQAAVDLKGSLFSGLKKLLKKNGLAKEERDQALALLAEAQHKLGAEDNLK